MTDYPPPPDYPPTVGMPTQWWTIPDPTETTPPELELAPRDWTWLHLTYNLPTLAAGTICGPAWHAFLHIAGDQYAFALATIGAAVIADQVKHWWLTRILVWTTVVGLLLDTVILRQILNLLTGAHQ